jgi:hypothetical protein
VLAAEPLLAHAATELGQLDRDTEAIAGGFHPSEASASTTPGPRTVQSSNQLDAVAGSGSSSVTKAA